MTKGQGRPALAGSPEAGEGGLRGIRGGLRARAFTALWAGLLALPFNGPRQALVLSLCLFAVLSLFAVVRGLDLLRRMQGIRTLIPSVPARWMPVTFALSFVLVPFFVNDYYLDVLVMSGIYAILAMGLNSIVGTAGLLHLGYAAFYAIGAYVYAILNTKFGLGFWPSLPLATGFAALAGLVLAIPALRLRGDYLAIVTLGFGEITRIVLSNFSSLTNGPNGIIGIAPPSVLGISLGRLHYMYYLALLAVVVTVVVVRRVEDSRIGRAWLAIKENEIAASTMGIDTTRYKLYAFAFGSFWAGLAGILFAAKMQFVSPESFTFIESVLILSMVILGGLGNTYGAVLGAVILVLLPEFLREAQLYRMLALGAGIVALMIFRPQGLLGGRRVPAGR